MRKQDEYPTNHWKLTYCEKCDLVHPAVFTVDAAGVGQMVGLTTSTVLTYHSRGGILPYAVGRPGGNPRWLTCQIAQWAVGKLPESEIEPIRIKKAS